MLGACRGKTQGYGSLQRPRHRVLFRLKYFWLSIAWILALPSWAIEPHRYQIRVDATLDYVDVTGELVQPGELVTARNGDARHLIGLQACDGTSLVGGGTRIYLPPSQRCFRYRHPLGNDATRRAITLPPNVSVTSPSTWLWLPQLIGDETVRVELTVAAGHTISVPWPRALDGAYRIPASPQSSRAYTVFGRFRAPRLTVGDTELTIALVDSRDVVLDANKTLAWLEAALTDLHDVYGRLPNPDVQVIVVPSGPSRWGSGRSPVPFGHVIRDGGETVQFFVDPSQPLDHYLSDWTANHEFAHLLLPYVDNDQKWISEGFASYYQNVLLARRGVYSESEAWQRLHRSFGRAREISNPPSPNGTNGRPFWEVRMLIYWSGAAIALLADQRLRQASDGVISLDTVLDKLQACCLPSSTIWQGRALFEKLDELSPHPVFVGLYDEYADAPGMPDLTTLYADFGIRVENGRVNLDDRAEFAHIRRAIMESY